MPETIEEWIELARDLLSPERTRLIFDEAAPVPAPSDIGAVEGFGRIAKDCDLRVSAYIFDTWAAGLGPMEDLKARAVAQGRKARAIVNGSVLIFATAGPADRDRLALSDLWSAFSFPPRTPPPRPED